MTPEHGLQACYVRGARGRRMRPVLMPGNLVEARLSARTEAQLAQARSSWSTAARRLLGEPLPAAAIDWATRADRDRAARGAALSAASFGARGLLDAIEAAPAASGWGAALVRYELLLLAELGFGLDLETLRGQRERR